MTIELDRVPTGMPMNVLRTLAYVAENPRASAGTIADYLDVTTAAVTGILDSGFRRGLLDRESGEDRRVAYVVATEEGKALIETLKPQLQN
jgi:MarR family transcriptional repressor of emrRAB